MANLSAHLASCIVFYCPL